MGQPITVTVRPSRSASVVHFELDRSLTGMEIERYRAGEPVAGDRPPDVLARRLLELGCTSVTVYSSMVTCEAPDDAWPSLRPQVEEAIRTLFVHYGPDATGPDMVEGGAGLTWRIEHMFD